MNKKSTGRSAASIKREIERLKRMPDSEIDTSDLPVLPPEKWARGVVGKFYKPVKQAIGLRVDSDVIAWFKSAGAGYQSRMNEALRETMQKGLIEQRQNTLSEKRRKVLAKAKREYQKSATNSR